MFFRSLLVVLMLVGPVAHAAEGTGEARQLTEQLVAYVEKGAWSAADRTYRKLESLNDITLTSDDLFMGAESARSLGNMLACRERLMVAFDRALMQEQVLDERARAWLAELQVDYGHVTVQSKGVGSLEASAPPFQPDRRAAIQYAARQIDATGRFDGLLPAGTYTWGKSEFTVVAGTEPVKVKLKGPKAKKKK